MGGIMQMPHFDEILHHESILAPETVYQVFVVFKNVTYDPIVHFMDIHSIRTRADGIAVHVKEVGFIPFVQFSAMEDFILILFVSCKEKGILSFFA